MESSNETKKRGFFYGFVKRLGLFLLFLLFLILLVIALLQIPAVQNWTVDQVSSYLNKKFDTNIEIESVDFSFIHGIEIKNVTIQEPAGKEMFKAGELSTSLEENLLSLFKGELVVNSLSIADLTMNIKDVEDCGSNIACFLNKFQKPKKENQKASKPFDINLNSINLQRCLVTVDNEKGSQSYYLEDGLLQLDSINVKKNEFYIAKCLISKPKVMLSYVNTPNKNLVVDQDSTSSSSAKKSSLPLLVVHELELLGGEIHIDSEKVKEGGFDPNNTDIKNINFNFSDIKFIPDSLYEGSLNFMTASINDELLIEDVSVDQFLVNQKGIVMDNFSFKTPQSSIRNTSSIKVRSWEDFKDFENKVFFNSKFVETELVLDDILYFLPELKEKPFFKQNSTKKIQIIGEALGRLNKLSFKNLSLVLDGKTELDGFISTRNITDVDRALINFDIYQLRTDMEALKSLIPGFKPPPNFYKLGKISFTGQFDGELDNFVANGDFNTDLGKATTDIQLDLEKGVNNAGYSGYLDLIDFDLNRWADNDDLGLISASAKIINGKGLTLQTAFADLTAELKEFTFKDYVYKDIELIGQLNKNQFIGNLSGNDEYANFEFDGEIALNDNDIFADFDAEIKKIDLQALNLVQDSFYIEGLTNVNFKGSNIDDFIGSASLKEIVLNYKGIDQTFDRVELSSEPLTSGGRNISLNSDSMDLSISGLFNFDKIDDVFKNAIVDTYPDWAKYLNVKKSPKDFNQNFEAKLNIQNSENLFPLLGLPNLYVDSLVADFSIHSKKVISLCTIDANYIVNGKDSFFNPDIDLNIKGDLTRLDIELPTMIMSGSSYQDINLRSYFEPSRGNINISSSDIIDSLEHLDLSINLDPNEDKLDINFIENRWSMLSTDWFFNEGNKLTIGQKSFELENMAISDGKRSISFTDIDQKGLGIEMDNFQFSMINNLINFPEVYFEGSVTGNVGIQNIFKKSAIEVDLFVDTLLLNKTPYGFAEISGHEVSKDKYHLDALILRDIDGQKVSLNMDIDTKLKALDGQIEANKFQLKFFEWIIKDGIYDTHGYIDVNGKIFGSFDDVKMLGQAKAYQGGTTVEYLGNSFYFDDQTLSITENFIDFTGAEIKDKFGNIAVSTGGLRHELFKNFTMDISMASDEFLLLDTKKGDNASYYGSGLGKAFISFAGPFHSPDIYLDAVTGQGTVLNIPVEDSENEYEEDFIEYIDRNSLLKKDTAKVNVVDRILKGVNFNMDLKILPEAVIRIIFDETLNDVIEGQGRGDLTIKIDRKGDFDIFGQYFVEQGSYLFTAMGIVAKPFTVERGGTITWTGDPINATLNLNAKYEGLRTSVAPFLEEYLPSGNANLFAEAQRRVNVDLLMKIGGELYNPEVQFDLRFPELQGELKSYADGKMRLLRQNQTELNDQVAGLLLFKSFLPSNSGIGGGLSSQSLINSGINTLSEFVSSQLSHFLTGIFNEALTENGLISGLDFDIGFSKNSNFFLQNQVPANSGFAPDEIEVHLKPRFVNDRWGFDVGTNYVRQSIIANNSYVFVDFVVEYYLTDDRRLKLKAYGKNDYDESVFEREFKYGMGLNYRKEFGDLSSFRKAFIQDTKTNLKTIKEGN